MVEKLFRDVLTEEEYEERNRKTTSATASKYSGTVSCHQDVGESSSYEGVLDSEIEPALDSGWRQWPR